MILLTEMWQAGLLFASAFTSATLLPGSSEVALMTLVLGSPGRWPLWLGVATCGNTLGALTNWGLGYWAARHRPAEGFLSPERQRALAWLTRHGYWTLLLAWLPVVGDGLCLLAGWLRWSWWRSSALIALGKGGRYLLLILLGLGVT